MAHTDRKLTLQQQLELARESVKWTRVDSNTIYNKPWAKVTLDDYQKASGEVAKEFVGVSSADYGEVLPYDPKSGEVVLIAEFHRGANEVLLKLPAGKRKQGQSELEMAQSELREETGLEGKLIPLDSAWEIGMWYGAVAHFALAEVDVTTMAPQILDENEEIAVITCHASEVYELIFSKDRGPIDGALVHAFLYSLESGLIDRKHITRSE